MELKKYRVDLKLKGENTYYVDAKDSEDAKVKAIKCLIKNSMRDKRLYEYNVKRCV